MEIRKYFSYQKYLSDELDRRIKNNSNYSTRAFARDLDVSISTLSNVLNFKKKLGVKAASSIIPKLGLKDLDKEYFKALVRSQIDKNISNRLNAISYLYEHGLFHKRKEYKDCSLSFLDNWYSLVVFSALDIDKVAQNPNLLLSSMGLSQEQLDSCIEKMLKLKLIEYKDGVIHKLVKAVEFNTDVPGTSIQNFHLSQGLKAQEMLLSSPLEERNFRHISFSIDKKHRPEILEKISKFFDELSNYQKLGEQNSLVAINLNSLFFNIQEDTSQEK